MGLVRKHTHTQMHTSRSSLPQRHSSKSFAYSMTSHLKIEPSSSSGGSAIEGDENQGGGESNEEGDQYFALINNLHCSPNVQDRFMLSQFKVFSFPPPSPPPPPPPLLAFMLPSPLPTSPPLSSSLISENRWLHTFLPIDAIPPRSCLIYHMAGALYES